MRIVVTVKDVPDVLSSRRLGPDGRLVRDGADSTVNELDENAVQAAVDLARAVKAEVVVLGIGTEPDAVRRGLQLGADRGILITDDRLAGMDAYVTAVVVAAAVRDLEADLVLSGLSAADGLTATVPGAVAARLGFASITSVAELDLEGDVIVARRDLPGVMERVSVRLPAVVSVTDAVNEPELAGFMAIRAARKKPLDRMNLDDLKSGLADLGMSIGDLVSKTTVVETGPRPVRDDRVQVSDNGSAGRDLAAWLVSQHLV